MRFLLSFLPICLFCASLANAGIVRVIANGRSFGQGWMFLDVDARCKVATPAHVIKFDDKMASTIEVLDDRGRTFFDVIPEVVSDPNQLDVAVLTINGASDPQTCGAGRLSVIGMARRIASMSGAILETTGLTEVVRMPVRARAASIDSDQGSRFTVQPINPKDAIKKGWSGSIIIDDDGPLGMVVTAGEGNEASAVRADVIRQLIDSSPVKSRHATNQLGRPFPPVILTTGSAADDGSTPAIMFEPDGQGWNVVPKDRKISFVIVLDAAVRLQRVRLSFKSDANSLQGMDVAISQTVDGSGWDSLKYCRLVGGTGTITCSVLAASVKNIRLSLKVSTDSPAALSDLTIE